MGVTESNSTRNDATYTREFTVTVNSTQRRVSPSTYLYLLPCLFAQLHALLLTIGLALHSPNFSLLLCLASPLPVSHRLPLPLPSALRLGPPPGASTACCPTPTPSLTPPCPTPRTSRRSNASSFVIETKHTRIEAKSICGVQDLP
ncbi:hypothetical protein ABZP36_030638 [Zizania latifolia]